MTTVWSLPPLRAGRPAASTLAERRAAIAAARPAAPQVAGVTVRNEKIGGVSCFVCEPKQWKVTLIYFHGGGYRLGDAVGWVAFGSSLAAASNARVVLVDYRVAPEYPFPACLYDGANVYDALLKDGALVIGGDSAGGGLALALALAAKQAGRPPASGLLLMSPWADLRVSASTYTSCAQTDQLFSRESASDAAELYLQGHAPEHPLASPVFGDLAGLPPTLMFVSTTEVLLDDGIEVARKMALGAGTVEVHYVPNVPHVWPTLAPDLPESKAAIEAMIRFLKRFA